MRFTVLLFTFFAICFAAPVTPVGEEFLVSRSNADAVLTQMDQIRSIVDQKRATTNEDELIELNKRGADTVSNLITAIYDSGILGNIWRTFLNDTQLQSAVWAVGGEIVSSIFNIIISWFRGPASTTVTILPSTATLSSTIVVGTNANGSATTTVGGLLGFIGGLFGGPASTTARSTGASVGSRITAAPIATTGSNLATVLVSSISLVSINTNAPQSTLDSDEFASLASKYQRSYNEDEVLSKRDAIDLVSSVISFLKSSGILTEVLTWFESNGSNILSGLGTSPADSSNVLSAISSATASANPDNVFSEILNTQAIATGLGATKALPTTTKAGTLVAATLAPLATTQLAVQSIALPTTNNANVLNSLAAIYGGATTLVRRVI